MPIGETNAATKREGVRALVLWLETMTGGRGVCPYEGEIAQHLRISRNTVGVRLQAAVALGMIRLSVPASRRMRRRVEVLRTDLPRPAAQPAPIRRAALAAPPPSVAEPLAPVEPRPRCDAVPLAHWLAGAARGSRNTYFVGHLAEERGKPPGGRDVAGLARAALASQAAADGLVILTALRHGAVFAYIAIRTARPMPRPA